ncbi:hypothetical protein [Roseivirga pacifica]
MKRALKYLTILGFNFIALISLLILWTDPLELSFNELVRPIEALKLISLSIILLIAIRVQITFFRQRKINNLKKRIRLSTALTILLSSYFYVTYTIKAVENRVIFKQSRKNVMSKVEITNSLTLGSKAENLTHQEYTFITQAGWFPEISSNATQISYEYKYDGFLPDYSLTIEYLLPKNENIEEFNIHDNDFFKSLTVNEINDKKYVKYIEGEQ